MTVRIVSTCTACGACLITCPTAALSPGRGRPDVADSACTDCLACIEVCPAGAISHLAPTAAAPSRPGPAS